MSGAVRTGVVSPAVTLGTAGERIGSRSGWPEPVEPIEDFRAGAGAGADRELDRSGGPSPPIPHLERDRVGGACSSLEVSGGP